MKKILFGLSISTAIIIANPAFAGWETQWIDKFDGNSVNYNIWTAEIQADFTGTEECYTANETPDTGNLNVSNGTLKIIAHRENINCPGLNGKPKTWTSGRLNTKDKKEFLYGRIEARLKFSNLESGLWPAFWALEGRINEPPIKGDNDNVPWPNLGAGEIDIWEWMASRPSTYFNAFHNIEGDNPTNPKCGKTSAPSLPTGPSDIQQWHTYAMEWTKSSINFYMDNNVMSTNDVSACPQYKEPMFALINIQIGNAGGPIDPKLNKATMEVDYVAHCVATDSNNSTSCNESTPLQHDDDGDGIRNEDDLCKSTPANTTVNVNGCGAGETALNIAPEVALSIIQNGSSSTQINTDYGFVSIFASVTDINVDDTHTYKWTLNGLVNTSQNASVITFDPRNLSAGTYSVSIDVSDNGSPVLSTQKTLSFTVVKPTPTTSNPTTSSSKSGGAINLFMLMVLTLIPCLIRTSSKQKH